MTNWGNFFLIFLPLVVLGIQVHAQNNGPEKEAMVMPAEHFDSVMTETVQNRSRRGKINNQDTIIVHHDDLPDPIKAALLSAALPGLGQIYNKSYWKVPIVYGSMLSFGYLVHYFDYYYINFRNAFLADNDGNPYTTNPYENDPRIGSRLYNRIEVYRRNRDYLMILTAAFYLLNIVEAHVDAHLQSFDLSDDISMIIRPGIIATPFSNQFGLSLNIQFK